MGWMIGILLWSLCRVDAQNRLKFIMDKEGKLFAIPVETNYEIRIPEVSYKSYTPVSEQNRQALERYQDIYQKFSEGTMDDIAFFSFPAGNQEADRPMNMNTLSEAYRPFFLVGKHPVRGEREARDLARRGRNQHGSSFCQPTLRGIDAYGWRICGEILHALYDFAHVLGWIRRDGAL